MDERSKQIEAHGRDMARLARLLEEPLAIAREHSTAGDLDYVTQQLLAARNEARRRAGDYGDPAEDALDDFNYPGSRHHY